MSNVNQHNLFDRCLTHILPAKALVLNEPNKKGEERILRTKNAIGIPVGMGQNLIGVSFL